MNLWILLFVCALAGKKPNGETKVRAVDHMTESLVNEATGTNEKLTSDTLDMFFELSKLLRSKVDGPLSSWKADIDSAFRRIPIAPEHRPFAMVAFIEKGETLIMQHNAMPFGAISSVFHWDRIGSLICTIARKVLRLPVLRYVDDFFTIDRELSTPRAKLIFARLVRCLLGETAISERKLEHGNPLTILGIEAFLQHDGATFRPNEEKAVKWSDKIWEILCNGSLKGGEASKLAGALQWATSHTFRRLGRAMLRPLFKQIRCRRPELSGELRLGLQWWLEVLSLEISEKRKWVEIDTPPVFMYCDARSTPPRAAAVLFWDGQAAYCDEEPSAKVMSCFRRRGDNQIMSLELLSIAYGISSFEEVLRGRNVVIFSDNTAAEAATVKG